MTQTPWVWRYLDTLKALKQQVFPLQPIGKGLRVCSKGVLKQPWMVGS